MYCEMEFNTAKCHLKPSALKTTSSSKLEYVYLHSTSTKKHVQSWNGQRVLIWLVTPPPPPPPPPTHTHTLSSLGFDNPGN